LGIVVVRLTWCRSGKNNYRNFNCYRDNGHQLYNDGTYSCFSIYYCLDVSCFMSDEIGWVLSMTAGLSVSMFRL